MSWASSMGMPRALRAATVNQARPARLVETSGNHILVTMGSRVIQGLAFVGGATLSANFPLTWTL